MLGGTVLLQAEPVQHKNCHQEILAKAQIDVEEDSVKRFGCPRIEDKETENHTVVKALDVNETIVVQSK